MGGEGGWGRGVVSSDEKGIVRSYFPLWLVILSRSKYDIR